MPEPAGIARDWWGLLDPLLKYLAAFSQTGVDYTRPERASASRRVAAFSAALVRHRSNEAPDHLGLCGEGLSLGEKTDQKTGERQTARKRAATGGAAGRFKLRRTLPVKLRMAVDRAIIERGEGAESLAKIHRRFKLSGRGVGLAPFRRYARYIEAEARDYFLASLLGSVFGQLTPSKQARLHDAAQNMIAGLVLKTIRTQEDELDLDTLAKLVRINADLRKAAAIRLESGAADELEAETGGERGGLSDRVVEQVRRLYGIEMSPEGSAQGQAAKTGGGVEADEG